MSVYWEKKIGNIGSAGHWTGSNTIYRPWHKFFFQSSPDVAHCIKIIYLFQQLMYCKMIQILVKTILKKHEIALLYFATTLESGMKLGVRAFIDVKIIFIHFGSRISVSLLLRIQMCLKRLMYFVNWNKRWLNKFGPKWK